MCNLKYQGYIFVLFMFIFGFTVRASAQSLNHFFDQTDAFLSANVQKGKVAYRQIKQKPTKLNALVQSIGSMSLDGANKSQKEAFYIDAYNLMIIHSIIKHGIPSSPQDVDGFFDSIKHPIAGEKLTLNQIEDKRLREVYQDPRLHFALVCAAQSCPPIRTFAYKPGKLNKQLTQVTRTTLNSDFIRFNKSQKSAKISEIFKWYKQDFVQKSGSVLAFIDKYRKQKIPADFSVAYYDYDWSLNDQ